MNSKNIGYWRFGFGDYTDPKPKNNCIYDETTHNDVTWRYFLEGEKGFEVFKDGLYMIKEYPNYLSLHAQQWHKFYKVEISDDDKSVNGRYRKLKVIQEIKLGNILCGDLFEITFFEANDKKTAHTIRFNNYGEFHSRKGLPAHERKSYSLTSHSGTTEDEDEFFTSYEWCINGKLKNPLGQEYPYYYKTNGYFGWSTHYGDFGWNAFNDKYDMCLSITNNISAEIYCIGLIQQFKDTQLYKDAKIHHFKNLNLDFFSKYYNMP